MRLFMATLSLVVLLMAGCGGEDPFAPKQRKVNTGGLGVVGSMEELTADNTAEKEAAAVPKTPPPAPPVKKAEVGVGEKGHYGGQGIVKTPVQVYFRAQERITFNVQIPNAMKLYKAMNNDKGPATHEEFMEKIIKANQVDLPNLPPRERYFYDPQKEELFIEQRK